MPHEKIQLGCLLVVLLVALAYLLLCTRGGGEP